MDEESLVEKVSALENELLEYQYSMGLLLIEKKELDAKYEELKHSSTVPSDTFKREQTAYSIAISEAEKREENLKMAFGVERQCVHDLEKTLREMRAEYAEIKFNTSSKLAEANALVDSVEEKSLEVEARVHEADAKLAEVSRKSAEVERKVQELEAQEKTLRRERYFFISGREAYESTLSRQKEDLQEWEHKLKTGEESMVGFGRLLNQRGEKANEHEKNLRKKQSDLEELQKMIDIQNSALKSKEDDVSSRIAKLALKEKEADDVRKSLELREQTLTQWEAELKTREELEIQKRLGEYKSTLERNRKESELEMDKKKNFHDDQWKSRVTELEKKESEINYMEEKLKKREQAVESYLERLREREENLDLTSKALEERETLLKVEENVLKKDRKQMNSEREDLFNAKAELTNLGADIETQQLMLKEKQEQQVATENERLEYERLQSELKQEMDKWILQNEQFSKEVVELKKEKERFEKEWEQLDDRRFDIGKELEDVMEKRKYFEKVKQSEEEKLNEKKLETEQYLHKGLESLELEKVSFASHMEHEKLVLSERYMNEKSQLLHDIELQKCKLETEIQKRQEEMECQLNDKVKSFEEERMTELHNITNLKEMARREMEEMKMERNRIEKEKMQNLREKKHVERQQCDMKKDLAELYDLSQKFKDQREQFVNVRESFIAFVEKQKSCTICGELIREYILSEIHPLTSLENFEPPPLPKLAKNYMEEVEVMPVQLSSGAPVLLNSESPNAGGTMSWLRKCTSKIFKISPGKKHEFASAPNPIEVDVNEKVQNTLTSRSNEQESFLQVVNDSFDAEIVPSGSGIGDVEAAQTLSSSLNQLDIPENSESFDVKTGSQEPVKDVRRRMIRTRSVEAVIAGAEDTLGRTLEKSESQYYNGTGESSADLNGERRAESGRFRKSQNRRKRNHMPLSQVALSDSDGYSQGHPNHDHRKKKLRVPVTEQEFVERRYNLRRPKVLVTTTVNGSSRKSRRRTKAGDGKNGEEDRLPGLVVENGGPKKGILEPGVACTLSGGVHVKDDDELTRNTDAASEFSADELTRFTATGDSHKGQVDTVEAFANDTDVIEINRKAEIDSEGRDDDDANQVHSGEVSVGKKLWNFLTTL